MRFASLGSGSEGNALVVEANNTRVMIDCGFGLRETVTRLGRLGLVPEQINGILITHEHADHISGTTKLAQKYQIPVWATYGTFNVTCSEASLLPRVIPIDSHEPFSIGDLAIFPFPVPHDAREPVQYVISDGAHRLGVLTDTGCSTAHIETMLNQCEALVLECNHDSTMLNESKYPPSLIKRIAGRLGHLANDQAAGLLAKLDCSRLQHIIAAHLSQQNNRPDLAQAALSQALTCSSEWIGIADQNNGFGWRQIS